jgi:hypothetical protein
MKRLIISFILLLIHLNLFSQMLKKENLVNYSYIINGKDDTGFLTVGTGSIIHYIDKYYLVTNFHVLTGKDANTNEKFHELRNTNNAISIIFQPLDRKSNFIVVVYPLFNSEGEPNFETFIFQNHIIDLSVMPIILPANASKFFFEIADINQSATYNENEHLMIFGFPHGQFKNSWQPTEFPATAIKNPQFGASIFDPFVFFDVTPIKGTSGSPIYFYDSNGEVKVISILSNEVDYDINHPNIKGRSVNALYAVDLTKKMYVEKKPAIKGVEYPHK